MADKATCPKCRAHTSEFHRTGRCPNGCGKLPSLEQVRDIRNGLVTCQLGGISAVESHLLDEVNQVELSAILGSMTAMTANVVRTYAQHIGIDPLDWWQTIIEIDNKVPRDPDEGT